jgi:ferritin-like metal-binding protein YciE
MTSREKLISWLRTAHAMEKQLVEILKHHAADAEPMPPVQKRIEEHRQETQEHARLVESCLKSLDADSSAIKDVSGQVMGNMLGISMDFIPDKMLANSIMDHATEHLEMALYEAIKAAAQELGEDSIVETCDSIIKEEVAMADWISQHSPELVKKVLTMDES